MVSEKSDSQRCSVRMTSFAPSAPLGFPGLVLDAPGRDELVHDRRVASAEAELDEPAEPGGVVLDRHGVPPRIES